MFLNKNICIIFYLILTLLLIALHKNNNYSGIYQKIMNVSHYSSIEEMMLLPSANSSFHLYHQFNHNLMELFNYINNSLEIKTINNSVAFEKLNKQMIRILAISRNLSINVKKKSKKILTTLSEYINKKIQNLQHPNNCSSAFSYIIIVVLAVICIIYCLTIAIASNRTAIINKNGAGSEWDYGGSGWNEIFQPITNCLYNESIDVEKLPIYTDPSQSDQIVIMPSRDKNEQNGFRDLPHMPPVLPNEFKNLLTSHHSNPSVWLLGKIIYHLWKETTIVRNLIKILKNEIQFHAGPIVGVHVRRTDKKSVANYHAISEYMKWVKNWFEIEETRLGKSIMPKRIFLATDEPAVIDEMKKHWGMDPFTNPNGYEIFAHKQNAQFAEKYESRNTIDSLRAIMAETYILSRCNYIVCTLSSNICRLLYELKQAQDENLEESLQSLDFYYDDWFYDHKMNVVTNYDSMLQNEILAIKDDKISISQVFWNGSIQGKNLRTGQIGFFPSYLLEEIIKTANFSIFDE